MTAPSDMTSQVEQTHQATSSGEHHCQRSAPQNTGSGPAMAQYLPDHLAVGPRRSRGGPPVRQSANGYWRCSPALRWMVRTRRQFEGEPVLSIDVDSAGA